MLTRLQDGLIVIRLKGQAPLIVSDPNRTYLLNHELDDIKLQISSFRRTSVRSNVQI